MAKTTSQKKIRSPFPNQKHQHSKKKNCKLANLGASEMFIFWRIADCCDPWNLTISKAAMCLGEVWNIPKQRSCQCKICKIHQNHQCQHVLSLCRCLAVFTFCHSHSIIINAGDTKMHWIILALKLCRTFGEPNCPQLWELLNDSRISDLSQLIPTAGLMSKHLSLT